MNKLEGFLRLADLKIPTVPWKIFNYLDEADIEIDPDKLWTVRCAVPRGNDFDLPKALGVTSQEAWEKAREFTNKLVDGAMVIYYPYFIAEKSGTLLVERAQTVIEAVDKDLWNLVTHGKTDVVCIYRGFPDTSTRSYVGNKDFLTDEEQAELLRCANKVYAKRTDDLIDGKAVLLEWSYAYPSNLEKEPVGNRYLVFYEMRTV